MIKFNKVELFRSSLIVIVFVTIFANFMQKYRQKRLISLSLRRPSAVAIIFRPFRAMANLSLFFCDNFC